jgi:O-antigen/teichoic acid export membrane protein
LLLAQGVSAAVGGFVTIYAVRHFTAAAWGDYSTAVAFVAIFTVFSGPGLTTLSLRELTSFPERQSDILGVAFAALAWTCGATAIALFIAALGLRYSHQTMILILVLSPLLAIEPLIGNIAAAFNARSRLIYVAGIQLARSLAFGGLAVLLIAISEDVVGLAIATLAAGLIGAIVGLALLRRKIGIHIRLSRARDATWSFLVAALPFASLGLVGVIYDRVDTLMLSAIAGPVDVAHYAAPYGFLRLAWILPSVVSAAFFPVLSLRIGSSPSEAKYMFVLVVRLFLALGIAVSLMLAVGSATLLPFLFGHEYAGAVPVLEVMAWASVCAFLNYILWYGIVVAHQERPVALVQIAGLVLNVAVNAVAIPLYGPTGAAAAFLISEIAVVVGQTILVHRKLFPLPILTLLLKPIGVVVVVVPATLVVATQNRALAAVGGGIAELVLLVALGYVTVGELRPLLELSRSLLRRVPTLGGT